MRDLFELTLKNNDLNLLRQIPKSDLHNHSTRGGNKIYIEEWANINIPESKKFKSLDDMQKWYDSYIKPYCSGKVGYLKRIEAAFQHAVDDGIIILHMSFGTGDKFNFNGSFTAYELNKIREQGLIKLPYKFEITVNKV